MLGDVLGDLWPADEGDGKSRRGPAAADEAADRAGAEYGDPTAATIRRDALVGQPQAFGRRPDCQKTSIGIPPRGYQ